MGNKYNIRLSETNTVEITKPNSSIVVYKFPYKQLMQKTIDTPISNRFIVYILTGKNISGHNTIYVGKSKNGLDNRPTAHETENIAWQHCYILTTFNERTFFNDGVIQYIENSINKMLLLNEDYINTTKVTNIDTVTVGDTEDCDEYISEVLSMLYILGLTIITKNEENKTNTDIPKAMEVEEVYNNFLNALGEE